MSVNDAVNAIKTQDSLQVMKQEVRSMNALVNKMDSAITKRDSIIQKQLFAADLQKGIINNLDTQVLSWSKLFEVSERNNEYLRKEVSRQRRSKAAIVILAIIAGGGILYFK